MIQEHARSATIVQFPVGGRDGLRALRDAARISAEVLPRGAALAATESWYHAEAIREDQQPHH